MPEIFLSFFFTHPQKLENFHLQFRIRNSDAAACQLIAIADPIILRADHFRWVRINKGDALLSRLHEHMMHRLYFFCIDIGLKTWEIDNPSKSDFIWIIF